MITKKQLEAIQLWNVAEGKSATKGAPRPTARERSRAQFAVAESITAGDFPTQILPAVRRNLLTRYESTPQTHQQFTSRKLVQAIDVDEQINIFSFGDQSNIPEFNMGDKFIPGGLPRIGQNELYPQIGMVASGKMIRASKIGEAFGINWEAIVRSKGTQINLIREGIDAFGRHASNQEDIDVYKLLFKNGAFNTGTGGGLNGATALTGNPDLTTPLGIQAALAQLLAIPVDGILPNYDKFVILTSRSNAPAIRQVINARRIVRNPGAATGVSWEETLDFGATVEIIDSKWVTALFPSIGKGAVIVPVGGDDELPVLTSNYLEGYETPSFWVKDSNARNFSGGEVNPEVDGDFDSDALHTKVRHVHGATALWNTAIGFTTGAGA